MILVTGSLAYDQIMDFSDSFADHIMPEKIHILNVSFLVNTLRRGFGGTAGNIAYNLSLLGIKVIILGVVGQDFNPYRQFLQAHNIETKYIRRIKKLYTSVAFGITDCKDNQIWGFYTGADVKSNKLSITDVKENIDFGIIAPHNPSAMLKFARQYSKQEIPYLFDPGMQLPWLKGTDLKKAFAEAKIIIGNDYEISMMEKKTGISDLNKLSKEGKIIITTLGEYGSRIADDGYTYKIKPAKPKNTSDPAGAGDAYRAGFMAGYLKGMSIKVCGRMGSVAAVYTVEKYGTTTHKFTIREFVKRYKDNYNQQIYL